MTWSCLVCGADKQGAVLSLGPQPVTKNLLDENHTSEVKHDLEITVCQICSTVQLTEPWPFASFVPWHSWMTFREPEDHLDDAVERILQSASLKPDSLIVGVSSKDRSTLERFRKKGFANTVEIDPQADLGITIENAYIECVQNALSPQAVAPFVAHRGKADCIVVRHIMEHAERPATFMSALESMLKPDGVILVEVPDSEDALRHKDYALPWEEHNLYFTAHTLTDSLSAFGLATDWLHSYPYAFENSLVAAVRPNGKSRDESAPEAVKEIKCFEDYAESFRATKKNIEQKIREYVNRNHTIILFGAGHLGCSFINYFGLAGFIDFAVDDAPEKQGLMLPGSRLVIRTSEELKSVTSLVCLLSVTPDKEAVVVERLSRTLCDDVIFVSIFSASPRYIGRSACPPPSGWSKRVVVNAL